jgi:hypothetical protein
MMAGYGAYLYIQRTTQPYIDPLVAQIYDRAAQVSSYAQYVETSQVSEAGTLQIKGEYFVDDAHGNYASYSTTTYRQTKGIPVVFLLENRTVGTDVYVRLTNKSPGVKLSVPAVGTWEHFPANSIPVTYQNIAVAGPVIDDLKLLDGHGKYLVLDSNHGMTSFDNNRFIRYTFKLSRLAELSKDGGIRTIAQRVGNEGLVDLWIDPLNSEVAHMRLTNGTSYTSTTTFSRINGTFDIKAPEGQ